MKNPNGYGCIYKLSGKRRKPWGIRITTGWDENKKQKYKPIGYYASRPEAMLALAEYNKNPYNLDSNITFSEVYEKWSIKKFPKISAPNINGYKASYKISEPLHPIKFVEIRKDYMQDIIDNCGLGHGSKRKIKTLYNQLFEYAMENDIVNKDYSDFVKVGPNEEESKRKPFTDAEIKLLWDNVDRLDGIDTVLIMIYSGMRPGELLTIETKNIDIDNRTMKGGIKNVSSKNRIIPINKKILPFINLDYKYLIVNKDNEKMSYFTYYDCVFKLVMEQLQLDHLPHDCRHTFATLMDNAGANKLSIKRIMGHASKDITDKVYTHKDIEELKKAIDLI